MEFGQGQAGMANAQMQYAGTLGQQAGVPTTSLSSDMNRACGRAGEMLSRLIKIADSLHGGTPRPADINKNPQPTPSFRRELDVLHQILSECEGEIVRIESRL